MRCGKEGDVYIELYAAVEAPAHQNAVIYLR
jgi:hypothetical protein